jgi:hypothetical protein
VGDFLTGDNGGNRGFKHFPSQFSLLLLLISFRLVGDFQQEITEETEVLSISLLRYLCLLLLIFFRLVGDFLTGDNGGNRGFKHFPSPFSLFAPVNFLSTGRRF